MSWQPQEAGLQQLSEVLKDSLNGADPVKQKQAEVVSVTESKDHTLAPTFEADYPCRHSHKQRIPKTLPTT